MDRHTNTHIVLGVEATEDYTRTYTNKIIYWKSHTCICTVCDEGQLSHTDTCDSSHTAGMMFYIRYVCLHILRVHVHACIQTCENIRSYRSILSTGQLIQFCCGACLELIENL